MKLINISAIGISLLSFEGVLDMLCLKHEYGHVPPSSASSYTLAELSVLCFPMLYSIRIMLADATWESFLMCLSLPHIDVGVLRGQCC